MVSDWIPHGTIPRILPILSGYQQSLRLQYEEPM